MTILPKSSFRGGDESFLARRIDCLDHVQSAFQNELNEFMIPLYYCNLASSVLLPESETNAAHMEIQNVFRIANEYTCSLQHGGRHGLCEH